MDGSPPGSSVHGILQERILEWTVIPFSRGSPRSRDQICVSCIAGEFFTTEPSGKPPFTLTQSISWIFFSFDVLLSDIQTDFSGVLFSLPSWKSPSATGRRPSKAPGGEGWGARSPQAGEEAISKVRDSQAGPCRQRRRALPRSSSAGPLVRLRARAEGLGAGTGQSPCSALPLAITVAGCPLSRDLWKGDVAARVCIRLWGKKKLLAPAQLTTLQMLLKQHPRERLLLSS